MLTIADVIAQTIPFQSTPGDDWIVLTSANETLTGGAGNDRLTGADGSDTYIFARGSGVDRIDDNGNGDTDVVQISGYLPGEVSLSKDSRTGANLVLRFAGTSDELTVENTLTGNAADQIEQIRFDDGTVWTIEAVKTLLANGWSTDGDDAVTTLLGDQTLAGGLGNDRLSAGDGSDTYRFARGGGMDVIIDNGDGDADVVKIAGYLPGEVFVAVSAFNAGTLEITFAGTSDRLTIVDALNGSTANQIERIEFDNGAIWTVADILGLIGSARNPAADESLDGDSAGNTLAGGRGSDWLSGKVGSDTYIFTRGDGSDRITDAGAGDTDIVRIAGYLPTEVMVAQSSDSPDSVILRFAGTSDELTISNTLYFSFEDEIEQIRFDDGTVWSMSDVRSRALQSLGSSGDDVIFTWSSSDTVNAGKGNDYVETGSGADTLVFAGGDGRDTVSRDINYGAADKLVFTDLNAGDIVVRGQTFGDGSLTVETLDGGDSIRFTDGISLLSSIQFANGEIWSSSQISAAIVQRAASPYETSSFYTPYNTVGAFAGTSRNERFSGNSGSDSYVWSRGGGHDTISDVAYDALAVNTLTLSDVASTEVSFAASWSGDDDLVIRVSGDSGSIVVDGFLSAYGGYRRGVDQIVFSDGVTLDRAAVLAIARPPQLPTAGDDLLVFGNADDIVAALAGDDIVRAGYGDDDITGGSGDDLLLGQGGSDAFRFTRGDGSDTIVDRSGVEFIEGPEDFNTLFLSGYTAEELIFSASVVDPNVVTLTFTTSADSISFRASLNSDGEFFGSGFQFGDIVLDDTTVLTAFDIEELIVVGHTITGTAGADVLFGTENAETIEAGLGNDIVAAGDGADIYVFSRGDGRDIIADARSI